MVEAAWKVVTPVLDVWQALPPRDFPNYESGSWGPKSADDLIQRDGRAFQLRPLKRQSGLRARDRPRPRQRDE